MKFPRIPVALLLVASLAWPVVAPSTSVAKTKAPKASKAPAKAKKKSKAAIKDSIRVADSLRASGLNHRLDSLKAIDALHRKDSLRIADSLHVIDSLLKIDSLRQVDSLRKIDSLDRIARTWYVTKIRDFTQDQGAARQILEKLQFQLLRSGHLSVVSDGARDTCASFDCSWTAGLASGAGRLFYSALNRTPDSAWQLRSWLFELPSGKKLDSASVISSVAPPKGFDEIARRTTRILHPTAEEARCNADSLSQAATVWALEIPVNHTTDSTMNAKLRGLFAKQMALSGRASSFFLKDSVYCPHRKCLDSLASSLGANRTLQFDISRTPDSSWRLGLVASVSATDSLIDSIVVTSNSLENLATKAMTILIPAPVSCRTLCTRPNPLAAKLVWSIKPIQSDSAAGPAALSLANKIADVFSQDQRSQFLTLKTSQASGDVLAFATTSQGITRLITGTLKGSDSMWHLKATITQPQKDSLVDTIELSRGGYRPRVLAWFARKLDEAAHPSQLGCGSPCQEESTTVATTKWAFAPTEDHHNSDQTLAKLFTDNLVGTMVSRKLGKVVSFPDTLPCKSVHCLDSIAASRGAQNVVWSKLSRTPDSSWLLSAKVTETSTDFAIDTTQFSDTGNPIEALGILPVKVIAALVPAAPRCDSCVSLDTLEAGLAMIEPKWTDVIDTLQGIFIDSLSGVLAREGHFQVLPRAATDSIHAQWKNDRCDSVCQAALRCKTGASYMVTSSVGRDGSGWRVSAQLTDLRTGKQISQMTTREPRNDIQRLREIAPWTARKLIGTDSTNVAPSSRRFLDIPWAKVVALAIPFTAGLVSVISRW